MKLTLWGTRGSLAAAGPETVRYGGNTACVAVEGHNGTFLVLDAGTGIRRLGAAVPAEIPRIDLLLTHLHMGHIQGLGFFDPLYREGQEVHIWGPPSTTLDLRGRLSRYLSPPLFPVRLRDLPCQLTLHDVPLEPFTIGGLTVRAALVCHPGPTVGYRIVEEGASLCYLPDHEPALGVRFIPAPDWISGFDLVREVDLLVHDTQYSPEEYPDHVGWGHSAISHTFRLASMARVRRLVTFHHDPSHDDKMLDHLVVEARRGRELPFDLHPGMEGTTFILSRDACQVDLPR